MTTTAEITWEFVASLTWELDYIGLDTWEGCQVHYRCDALDATLIVEFEEFEEVAGMEAHELRDLAGDLGWVDIVYALYADAEGNETEFEWSAF